VKAMGLASQLEEAVKNTKTKLTKSGVLVASVGSQTIRLTKRQRYGIRRIGGNHPISPDLARQLIKKGLVKKIDTYERVEWNRVIAVLWVCDLTKLGESILSVLGKD
jgi:hypothetical protein